MTQFPARACDMRSVQQSPGQSHYVNPCLANKEHQPGFLYTPCQLQSCSFAALPPHSLIVPRLNIPTVNELRRMGPFRFCVHSCVLGLVILLTARIYEEENNQDFCYVNQFTPSDDFRSVLSAAPYEATHEFITNAMHFGQPFVVSGVTRNWGANSKWNHSYFESLFKDHELFSSTFATDKSPHFSGTPSVHDVYFGIFLNDRKLAERVAEDYAYPDFIPVQWRTTGNEWLHWGYPPCGAQRHMDLMCTSRLSVQVKGMKKWRLYPLLTGEELEQRGLGNWTKVLHKLDVTLQPGDALVWFPGWEHETRILIGPSISLSLHFTSPADSTYQNTFSEVLRERVSLNCKWKFATPT